MLALRSICKSVTHRHLRLSKIKTIRLSHLRVQSRRLSNDEHNSNYNILNDEVKFAILLNISTIAPIIPSAICYAIDPFMFDIVYIPTEAAIISAIFITCALRVRNEVLEDTTLNKAIKLFNLASVILFLFLYIFCLIYLTYICYKFITNRTAK